MSSNPEAWSHVDEHWTRAREYYLSQTLASFDPGAVRGAAVLCFVAGCVGAALMIAASQTTGTAQTVLFWCMRAVGVAVLWAVAYGLSQAANRLAALLEQDDAEGRKIREPLVRRVREFAEKQDVYVDLMTMSQDKLRQWVIDSGGYYTIRDEWPADLDAYAKLVSEPYYQAAVRQLFPVTSTGKEVHPGDAPFEKIIEKRKRLYAWAMRDTTPAERAKARIARSEVIDTEEELAAQRLRDLADKGKKPPPSAPWE
jgi:hypothetical protein